MSYLSLVPQASEALATPSPKVSIEQARKAKAALDKMIPKDRSLLAKMLGLGPEDADVLLRQGTRELFVGQHERAIELFRVACVIAPHRPEAWRKLSVAYDRHGNKEQANTCKQIAEVTEKKS